MAKKQEKNRADEAQGASAEASPPAAEIFEPDAASPQVTAEIEALQQELAGTRAKMEEYLDGWQRSRAEFANYKKRVEREQAQAYQNARGAVIKHFLEVLDDLERALKNRPQDEEGQAWVAAFRGIELVYRKLLTALEGEGVTRMQADGQFFDPNLHEAVTSEDSEAHQSGQIIEVLQHGYLLGERVLRPAVVRVAR